MDSLSLLCGLDRCITEYLWEAGCVMLLGIFCGVFFLLLLVVGSGLYARKVMGKGTMMMMTKTVAPCK